MSKATATDSDTPASEADEFWHNIWWVPDGKGMLRTAHLSECATEIKRLRAEVRQLRDEAQRLRVALYVGAVALILYATVFVYTAT